jgi:energy-coupling factor transporter ATP-binding protein EcfA2
MKNKKFLEEISRWRLEAKEENNARYFYTLPAMKELEDGNVCYVIGRKGSGKTAIAEHLRGTRSHNFFIQSLSFKNFPFNELYKFEDKKFTTPSQYVTIWKYIIYSAICSMMAENERLDAEATVPLRHHFRLDFGRALAGTLTKLTDQSFGLNLFGIGGNIGGKTTHSQNEAPISNRVESLERIIDKYIDDSSYYIVFDELDEDYQDIFNIDRKSKYFDLLVGLFKAVHDIRGRFRSPHRIRPIVFLRDDIYDIILNNDKNKWDDLAINLKWTEDSIQPLMAFRISRAINENGQLLQFQDAYNTLFSTDTIRYGQNSRRRRTVLKHIFSKTLMRPRDVVSYLRECASIASERNEARITAEIIRDAEEAYSQRFRNELVDEIQSIMPYIPQVFDLLATMRKQIFTFSEFHQSYDNVKNDFKDALSFDEMCMVLFHFSVIGNQPSQMNARIFKYQRPGAKINFGEQGIVHLGLLKGLQIV